MNTSTRKAYVAGKFYPDSPLEIYQLIEMIRERESDAILQNLPINKVIGGILPHAGHVFSGYQTVHFFEILLRLKQEIDTFIILHPIHRGGSLDYACDENDAWSTPMGKIELDKEFIHAMKIPLSEELHRWEHSAEVLLPFLQVYNYRNSKIVPAGICWQHPESSRELANKIIDAEAQTKKRICILASSDFSHFLDPVTGAKKDQLAINDILRKDPDSLFKTVLRENITMCGYGPVMTLLFYINLQDNKTKVDVLSKGHSGLAYPSERVVDYVSMIFYT